MAGNYILNLGEETCKGMVEKARGHVSELRARRVPRRRRSPWETDHCPRSRRSVGHNGIV